MSNENSNVPDVKLVPKLSMKTIHTNAAKWASDEGTPIALIFGRAVGTKLIEDKINGKTFVAVVGSFEAHNLKDGGVYRSGLLYLPESFQNLLMDSLTALEADDSDGYVSFALEMSAVKASNPSGYSYQAKPLTQPKQVDPLAQMRLDLAKAYKPMQLEAPAAPPAAPSATPPASGKGKGKSK